jgi:hypothetical protein
MPGVHGRRPEGDTVVGRHVRELAHRWRDRNKPRLHFLHIGKTGGTAIKHVLRDERPTQYRVLLHPHRIHLADVPAGEKVALVVRDPVGRFVSGFNSRIRRGGPAHPREWSPAEAVAFERFPTAESLALALGSADPAEAAAARDAVEAMAHLRVHQTAWFGDLDALRARQDDLLMVGRQWALAEDFGRLADLIGLPTRSLPTDESASHRTPVGFDTTLSDRARAAVQQWYADDYALLAELQRLGPAVGFLGDLPPQLRL